MNTPTTLPEIIPYVANIDGEARTTSLKIAEHFGKRHERVMAAIRELYCSPDFTQHNFVLCEYESHQKLGGSRKYPMYQITKDGFLFLVMGFSGKQAAQIKEAYINAFNQMAAQLKQSDRLQHASTVTAWPTLSIQLNPAANASARYMVYTRGEIVTITPVRDDQHVVTKEDIADNLFTFFPDKTLVDTNELKALLASANRLKP